MLEALDWDIWTDYGLASIESRAVNNENPLKPDSPLPIRSATVAVAAAGRVAEQ